MQTQLFIFPTASCADAAVRQWQKNGISTDTIGVVARESEINEQLEDPQLDNTSDATREPTSGGLLDILTGMSVLAVPGLGMLAMSGVVLTVFGSTVTGPRTGVTSTGIIATVVSTGVSEEAAQLYAEAVKRGGVLIIVMVERADTEQIVQVASEAQALDTEMLRESLEASGWKEFDATMDPGEHYPRLQN